MTDQELVDLVLNKDKENYAKIIEKYERQIMAYILRLLNFHREDASDACSNTFIKAYVNLNGYNPKLKFSSWLYRIAHNEAVNLIKKNSRSSTIDITDKENSFSCELDFEQFNKDALEKVLTGLKLKDKDILTLFYLQERTIKELSEILKCSEGSVKTRLNRARNRAKIFAKKINYQYV